jgi:hypothetical protein
MDADTKGHQAFDVLLFLCEAFGASLFLDGTYGAGGQRDGRGHAKDTASKVRQRYHPPRMAVTAMVDVLFGC